MTISATVAMINNSGQLKSNITGSGLLVVGRGHVTGNGGGLFSGRFGGGCGGLVIINAFFEGGDTFANFAHQGRNLAFAKQDKNNNRNQKKAKGSGSVHEKFSKKSRDLRLRWVVSKANRAQSARRSFARGGIGIGICGSYCHISVSKTRSCGKYAQMSRSNRLFDLIQILRDGHLHRAADLAGDLGVSVRSIWRDMAVLSASGMPVEGERGVGYILRQPITLPPMMLQPAELVALRLGVRLVAEGADPNLAAAARSLAGKIATVAPAPRDAGAGEDLFAPAPSTPVRASPHLPMLRKAIRQSERLTIAVLDRSGQLTQRDIRPLALTLTGQTWVLGAWCDTKVGFATFGLDRLLDIVPRGAVFSREAGKRLADYRKWQAQGAGLAEELDI